MEQNYVIVTESCSEIRALARRGLEGKWSTAVLVTLLQGVIMGVPVFIISFLFESAFSESIAQLYALLVGAPLNLGLIMVMLKLFRDQKTSAGEIFNGFERLFKAVGLYLMIYIFVFLWTLLLVIPGIIAAYRYSMAFYIMADNPDKPIMQCIDESKMIMNGNKGKLFLLELSFIGWIFLVGITFGIAALWVAPYTAMAEVVMYELITGKLRVERSGYDAGNEYITAQPRVSVPDRDTEQEAKQGVQLKKEQEDANSEADAEKLADAPEEYMPKAEEKEKQTILDGKPIDGE